MTSAPNLPVLRPAQSRRLVASSLARCTAPARRLARSIVLASGLLALLASTAQAQPVEPPTDVASYELNVRLDEDTKQLLGTGRLTYRNPSPDILTEVWLRLYLNAFRSRETEWMREAAGSFRGAAYDPSQPGWIRLEELSLAETGERLPLPDGREAEATIIRVPLPRPLPPGGTLQLVLRWTAQLPLVFARTGFAGDFIMAGQWYPKLAVYDRGRWDTEPWHAFAEFFADFGSYDLTLIVPERYITGASGVRLSEVSNSDGTKTVHYRAERVTDVAWTAWPDFRVIQRKVVAAGAPVLLEVLLPPAETAVAERHLAAAQAALDHFGTWYGRYPWPKLTIVIPPPGGDPAGGMEYPTLVTTDRSTVLPFGLSEGIRQVEIVTTHEIAHQWFPMQVQSNEGAEPWLDEGFADYLTIRLLSQLYGEDRSVVDLPFARLGYATLHRANLATVLRQPIAQAAWDFRTFPEYTATVYSKGSLALLTLERLLGEERFTQALRHYVTEWRWRHPTTDDLQAALEESTGQPLGWFFEPLVSGREILDYGVARLEPGRAVVVERHGAATAPVHVRVVHEDGSIRDQQWDGRAPYLELDDGADRVIGVAIDPEQHLALEADRLDNARTARPDVGPALALANRWLGFIQMALHLLGQIG